MSDNERKDLPDFAQLNDRIISAPPTGPFLAIRTNLDELPEETEDPYLHKNRSKDPDQTETFFRGNNKV